QLLEKENDFDVEKMKGIQLDNTSYFATDALPVLLNIMDRKALPAAAQKRLAALEHWKGAYNCNDQEARLFELWWNNVKDYTWDELKNLDFYSRMPDDRVLLDLITHEPNDSYFDKQGTTKVETAPDIVSQAFSNAVASYDLLAAKGESSWGSFNKVNIKHFTNLDAFSRTNLPSAGYTEAINAVSSNWGPSWRMIVELGDRPRAFGIYAGGQSGDVGSPYYDNFIGDWAHGKYYPLTFFMSMNEAMKQSAGSWKLK
ncbi:MAG TPA: penicillin acylase family protein, partial [Chitinophaga sp.]|uniref:penicillin acylase family protein n=1 Tax=Chitinophaga sp. TaxID=1869181 RepID=UPI002C30E076